MGTATSRRAALALAVLSLLLAGCGAGSGGTHSATTQRTPTEDQVATFAWLRPSPLPANWPVASIPAGASMAYPPAWTRTRGDPGTASAAFLGASHVFRGYLNLTPRQGAESLSTWARFRVEHNGEEGDRHVRTLGAVSGRRFSTGTGSCVNDAYVTGTGARYIEIACLVAGRHASTVIVGASTPEDWARVSPLLERAIASLRT